MRRTRHVATRSRSTTNHQNRSSAGSPQSVDVHVQQTEPSTNIDSSSQDEVQANPTSNSVPVMPEGSRVISRKAGAYWTVTVINDGRETQTRLRVQDVLASSHNSPKVITRWNRDGQPVGDSAGLLAGYLGALASNFNNFPIMFETWKDVPEEYKDNIFYQKVQAYFVVNDGDNKKYILSSMGKKWRDQKCRLFTKYYNWELSLEENIRNHPPHVNKDQWAVYIRHRRSPKAMEIADKNASNREKLLIPHTLGSKTLARKRDELELQDGRQYTRGEMYPISHKKKDGSFVNEEARQINEELQKEIHESSSENAAFVKVFGKEHPGYVRGMGLGITPTQINGARPESSSQSNAKIEKMQAEIDYLKEQVSEVDVLKEQIAFLMRNAKGNQLNDLESPTVDVRRSSESSHVPQDHATSSRGTI